MNYRALVDGQSFIGRYMDIMAEQETAEVYDFFCALWLISLACGRSVYVDRPRAPVYLNLYAILTAESGITRKSTAVRSARHLAQTFIAGTDMRMFEGKTTPEKLNILLHDMTAKHGHAHVAFVISELAAFLGTEGYTYGMPTLLTDLYDCPDFRSLPGTVETGEITQRDVFVSFLSASTPSWLLRVVNPIVVEGGFTSRCLFIHSEIPSRRIAWPTNSATVTGVLSPALFDYRARAEQIGTIGLTQRALDYFTVWYNSRKLTTTAGFTSSFESREDAHVLRIAALLAVNSGDWCINQTHLGDACKIVSICKNYGTVLFAKQGELSDFMRGVETIRRSLIQSGESPIARTVLHTRCRRFLSASEFTALLDWLHTEEMIQRFELKHGAGRPAEVIRGTRKLMDRQFIDKVKRVFQ